MLSVDLVEAAWGSVDASDVLEDSALFVSCGRSHSDRRRAALLIEPLSQVLRVSDWSAMRGQLNRATVTLDRVGSNGCMLLALYGGARLLLEVQQRCAARRRLALISYGMEESERQGMLSQIDAVLEECAELQRQVNPWTDQARSALWSVCEENGPWEPKTDGRLKAYVQVAPSVAKDPKLAKELLARGWSMRDHAVAEKRGSLPCGASDVYLSSGTTTPQESGRRHSSTGGRALLPNHEAHSNSSTFERQEQESRTPSPAGKGPDMPAVGCPKRRADPKSNNTWIRRNLRRSLTVREPERDAR